MEENPIVHKNKKTGVIPWIWLGLALIYTISPIDLVPDAFPILGWLDDITLLNVALLNLVEKYHEKTHTKLAYILRYLKWILLVLGIIVLLLMVIVGYLVYSS